jgi:hypothetical protein
MLTEQLRVRAVGVAPVPVDDPEPAERTPPASTPLDDYQLPPPSGITWRSARNLGILVAAVLAAVLVMAGLAVFYRTDRVNVVTAPLDGRQSAELHLVSSTTTVAISTKDIGGDLYRVATPPDGDSIPRVVERSGVVELHLVPSGRRGPAGVDIALNPSVAWSLRLSGGAVDQVVDLRTGRLTGLDLVAGATRMEVYLPAPEGTQTVRVGTGAQELTVHVPDGVPVRARLNAGAGRVVLDGTTHNGIGSGAVLTADGWPEAEHRYEIDSAGLGVLTIAEFSG